MKQLTVFVRRLRHSESLSVFVITFTERHTQPVYRTGRLLLRMTKGRGAL